MALRPARLLPPKRLLTPRSARRLSTTNQGLLPGAPAITRAGLAPAGLVQFSGRNTNAAYAGRWARAQGDFAILGKETARPRQSIVCPLFVTCATDLRRRMQEPTLRWPCCPQAKRVQPEAGASNSEPARPGRLDGKLFRRHSFSRQSGDGGSRPPPLDSVGRRAPRRCVGRRWCKRPRRGPTEPHL